MYISFKLALRKLFSSPGTYVTQGIIMFIFMLGILICLLLDNSSTSSIKGTYQEAGNEVRLTSNLDITDKDTLVYLTDTIAGQLDESPYVKAFNHHFSVPVMVNLKGAGDRDKNEALNSKTDSNYSEMFLKGDKNPDFQSDLRCGGLKIISGRFYTLEEVEQKKAYAVISKPFAEKNKLKTGSSFIICAADKQIRKELRVVGIFDTAVALGPDTDSIVSQIIYVPIDIAQAFGKPKGVLSYASYFLDKPEHIELLKQEAKNIGIDMKKFNFRVNDSEYKEKIERLTQIKRMTVVLIIVSIIVGALSIYFYTYYFIRKRKCEIGVLYIMGFNKSSIVKQFIIEFIFVSVIALGAAGITGIAGAEAIQKILDILFENIYDFTVYLVGYRNVSGYLNSGVVIGTTVRTGMSIVRFDSATGLVQRALFLAAAVPVILSGISAIALSILNHNEAKVRKFFYSRKIFY